METCDMIYGELHSPEFSRWLVCRKPAVARTDSKVSVITHDGHVRYCRSCLKTAKAWGVKTVPWPPK